MNACPAITVATSRFLAVEEAGQEVLMLGGVVHLIGELAFQQSVPVQRTAGYVGAAVALLGTDVCRSRWTNLAVLASDCLDHL